MFRAEGGRAVNPDMTVRLCGVEFKNPVIGASGTFAFGLDMADFF